MAHLIDKSALVAEIERRIAAYRKNFDKVDINIARILTDGKIEILKDILSFIDTLKVKEVDLDKEYQEYVEEDPVYNKLVNGIVGKALAKHFFELGLKAQKEK